MHFASPASFASALDSLTPCARLKLSKFASRAPLSVLLAAAKLEPETIGMDWKACRELKRTAYKANCVCNNSYKSFGSWKVLIKSSL